MFKELIKGFYYLLFPLYKKFKYPTCTIKSNQIHPKAKVGKYVEIEKYCKIDKDVEIGDYTYINEYTRIDANTKSIGKYCSISHNVKIGMGPHPLDYVSTSPVFYSKHRGYVKTNTYNEYKDKGYTKIGHDVFIAANSIIFAGVKIGTGAVIGAGSIVTKDIPPYALVAGSPARIIRYRFASEQIKSLLDIKWWEKDNTVLLNHYNQMSDVENFIKIMRTNENNNYK